MNMHRALLAVVMGIAAAPASAQEAMIGEAALTQDAAMTQEAAAVQGGVSLEAASLFAPVPTTAPALVAIKGVVSGSPESVTFSGNAKVTSRLAPDPDFNRPRLVLSLDLSGVAGVGSATGAKYVISGPELLQRQVAASYAVEITFPFRSSTAPAAATARTGVASFVLDFDVNTGAVIRASGNVSSPNFPR